MIRVSVLSILFVSAVFLACGSAQQQKQQQQQQPKNKDFYNNFEDSVTKAKLAVNNYLKKCRTTDVWGLPGKWERMFDSETATFQSVVSLLGLSVACPLVQSFDVVYVTVGYYSVEYLKVLKKQADKTLPKGHILHPWTHLQNYRAGDLTLAYFLNTFSILVLTIVFFRRGLFRALLFFFAYIYIVNFMGFQTIFYIPILLFLCYVQVAPFLTISAAVLVCLIIARLVMKSCPFKWARCCADKEGETKIGSLNEEHYNSVNGKLALLKKNYESLETRVKKLEKSKY